MSDDLDEDDIDLHDDEDVSFDEFDETEGSIGSFLQDNPMAKIGAILAVAAVVFGIIILFGGDEEIVRKSQQTAGSQVSGVPGTQTVSPEMQAALEDKNQQNLEAATATRTSNIPIPIQTPDNVFQRAPTQETTEDALQRWRRLQQERLNQELQRNEVIEPTVAPQDTAKTEAVQNMAGQFSAQMQSILAEQTGYTWQTRSISPVDLLSQIRAEEEAAAQAIVAEEEALVAQGAVEQEIILPAGQIVYAQLINEANSDVPGPIAALIVSGPLRGSRVLGSFSESEDTSLLTLNFDTIIIDGISQPTEALALDTETTLGGMATDVDNRYLKRIGLPLAAAFIEGMAGAAAETTSSTVSVDGEVVSETEEEAGFREEVATGIEEAGSELRTILEDIADVDPLIVVAAGTPMGLLFLDAVTRDLDDGI